MTNDQTKTRKPVLTLPPVDGTEDELQAWADDFLETVLGPIPSTSPAGSPSPAAT